jgi:hypothetical protein
MTPDWHSLENLRAEELRVEREERTTVCQRCHKDAARDGAKLCEPCAVDELKEMGR